MEEIPKRQPRGIYIPEDVVQLFFNEIINAKEAILLAFIDAYVSDKRGCYASNKHLAGLIQVKVRMLQTMLENLKKLELVDSKEIHDGSRELFASYSRINLKDGGGAKNCRGRKKLHTPRAKNCAPYPLLRKGSNSKSILLRAPNALNGEGLGLIQKEDPTPKEMAKYLYEKLAKNRKIQRRPNFDQWCKSFKELIEKDKVPLKNIKKVLKWYCSQLDKLEELYLPQAYSAKKFREKFDDIWNRMKKGKKQITSRKEADSDSEKYKTYIDEIIGNVHTLASFSGKEQVRDFIAKSFRGAEEVYNAFKNKKTSKDDMRFYKKEFINSTSVSRLVESFAIWTENRLAKWKDWNGTVPKPFSISDNNTKQFLLERFIATALAQNKEEAQRAISYFIPEFQVIK